MKKYGKEILCREGGEKLFFVKLRDTATSRVSYGFYTVNSQGEMSCIIKVKRSDILVKTAPLDFLLDLDLFLEKKEIELILEELKVEISDTNMVDTCSRMTISDIYNGVVEFIKENKTKKGAESTVFVEKGFGYVETKTFDMYVCNNKNELSASRKEILENLKIMGVLKPDRTRPYDVLKKIDGTLRRFYQFELPDKFVDGTEAVEEC